MPRDQAGASAPRPLRQWILRLERARLAAKKARRVEKRRRADNQQRLEQADHLLAQVIDGADVVAQAETPSLWGGRFIFLLVSLAPEDFNRLAEYGSELEDLEDTNDCEPDEDGEPSIGVDEYEFDPCDQGERKEYATSADRAILDTACERSNAKEVALVPVNQTEIGRVDRWLDQRRAAR